MPSDTTYFKQAFGTFPLINRFKFLIQILLKSDLRTYELILFWLLNNSQLTQLTRVAESKDIHPTFTPDGKSIIFSSNRGLASGKKNFDIWIMNANGSNPRQLTTNGSVDNHPVKSDDGKTICFCSKRGVKWDIWMMEMVK